MNNYSRAVVSFGAGLLLVTKGIPSLLAQTPEAKQLAVPYVSQVPDGAWVLPWSQACEEASISMIQYFYEGKTAPSKQEGKNFMQSMITWENEQWKKNEDTNAVETEELIETKSSFEASVKRNPTIEDIKEELRDGQPVIAFLDMNKLYQEAPLPDPFHVVVISGFDEGAKTFTVLDPAREGAKAYSYDRVMNSLHDYNESSKLPDGEATVLFTEKGETVNPAEPTFWQKIVSFFQGLFR